MKLSASNLFKDKKLAYPSSIPKPFITTHLCKSKNEWLMEGILMVKFDDNLYLFVAREDMRLKETHFDVKQPQAGAHKVCTCLYLYGKGRQFQIGTWSSCSLTSLHHAHSSLFAVSSMTDMATKQETEY